MLGARCIVCGRVKWHDPNAAPLGVGPTGQFEVSPADRPDALLWKKDGLAAVACGHHPPRVAQACRVALGEQLVREGA